MKYYFITYQAQSKFGPRIWNAVINESPMSFIKNVIQGELEKPGGTNYMEFVVTNTLEISKEEFEEFKDKF